MRVKLSLCGRELVVPLAVAEEIMELAFKGGEVVDQKWHRGENGAASFYTTHVYEINPLDFKFSPEMYTEAQYQMFKLAGKPT